MVTAFVRRKLGRPVNRKRVLRVMRERKLIQRRRPLERRKRPGFFQVERPRHLWQLDMTSVWVAEHGWTYLMAIIDCCTREIVAWQLELRCRADEAITVIERAAAMHAIGPGELTLGSDNGSAFTARRFRARLAELNYKNKRPSLSTPAGSKSLSPNLGWRSLRMLADELDFVVGVDPHRDSHAIGVVEVRSGVVVFESSVSADSRGYAEALRVAEQHAPGRRAFAVEGTGSFGAGLTRFLADHGEQVFEVGRLRRERRSGGKTDALDAVGPLGACSNRNGLQRPAAAENARRYGR